MTPQFNIPLIAKVWAWVQQQGRDNDKIARSYPGVKDGEQFIVWAQGSWRTTSYDVGEMCGTGMCFAGYATHLAGAKFLDDRSMSEWLELPTNVELPSWMIYPLDDGAKAISIENYAKIVLGIPDGASGGDGLSWHGQLFDSTNTAEIITEILDGMFAHYGMGVEWTIAKAKVSDLVTA